MTVWYTADTHFGHDSIIKHCKRPFESAAQMDAVLIENLCARVGPQDTLWIVGDFAFGPKAKDRKWLSNLFSRLPGKEKHLIVGNHDGEATQQLPWTSVSQMAEVEDGNGPHAVLNHYPMITWHRARKGALHLFGHVHDQWIGSRNAVRSVPKLFTASWSEASQTFQETRSPNLLLRQVMFAAQTTIATGRQVDADSHRHRACARAPLVWLC